MNKQTTLSILAIATGAIATFQSTAHAATFTAQDARGAACSWTTLADSSSVGSSVCNVNGFTLKATTNPSGTDRNITYKEVGVGANRVGGLGVRNGTKSDPSGGEIDVNELLSVDFNSAGILKELDLSFLYRPNVYYDKVLEVALVQANGALGTGILKVIDEDEASWDLGGVVTNLAISSVDSGGSYRISNPFGNTVITGFSLTAVPQQDSNGGTPTGSANSDFALSRVEVMKVPEPTALAGLGMFGLLAYARRRKAVKA